MKNLLLIAFVFSSLIANANETHLNEDMYSHYGYAVLQLSWGNYNFNTEIYFNSNATQGLDPGYDAALPSSNADYSIYTYLADDSNNLSYVIQSLNNADLNNAKIPVGVNATAGEEVVISISATDIPSNIEIYLEDSLNGTISNLREIDYVFTSDANVTGKGRFYLNVVETTLNLEESIKDSLDISYTKINKTININGELKVGTSLNLYDVNGKKLLTNMVDTQTTFNTVDVSSISTGVRILEIVSDVNRHSYKIIIQ